MVKKFLKKTAAAVALVLGLGSGAHASSPDFNRVFQRIHTQTITSQVIQQQRPSIMTQEQVKKLLGEHRPLELANGNSYVYISFKKDDLDHAIEVLSVPQGKTQLLNQAMTNSWNYVKGHISHDRLVGKNIPNAHEGVFVVRFIQLKGKDIFIADSMWEVSRDRNTNTTHWRCIENLGFASQNTVLRNIASTKDLIEELGREIKDEAKNLITFKEGSSPQSLVHITISTAKYANKMQENLSNLVALRLTLVVGGNADSDSINQLNEIINTIGKEVSTNLVNIYTNLGIFAETFFNGVIKHPESQDIENPTKLMNEYRKAVLEMEKAITTMRAQMEISLLKLGNDELVSEVLSPFQDISEKTNILLTKTIGVLGNAYKKQVAQVCGSIFIDVKTDLEGKTPKEMIKKIEETQKKCYNAYNDVLNNSTLHEVPQELIDSIQESRDATIANLDSLKERIEKGSKSGDYTNSDFMRALNQILNHLEERWKIYLGLIAVLLIIVISINHMPLRRIRNTNAS